MGSSKSRTLTLEAHEVWKLFADLKEAFSVDSVEPMAKLFVIVTMSFIRLLLESCSEFKRAASLMNNLIFTEKRTFSKDCQDEQASAVNYINLTLVDEKYLIWLFLNSYHSLIVVEDLDVQVCDDFSQK